MLLTGAVLREQARQVAVIDPQHQRRTPVRDDSTDPAVREPPPQERLGLGDDPWVLRVEREAQALAARHGRDVAVAEVEAEQLRVVSGGQLDPVRGVPAAPAQRARRNVALIRPAPLANRRPRHSEPSTDLAIVDPRGDQIERSMAELHVVHYERMFPSTPDSSGIAGCYPDARLAAIV
jgi:hypothetical protein